MTTRKRNDDRDASGSGVPDPADEPTRPLRVNEIPMNDEETLPFEPLGRPGGATEARSPIGHTRKDGVANDDLEDDEEDAEAEKDADLDEDPEEEDLEDEMEDMEELEGLEAEDEDEGDEDEDEKDDEEEDEKA